MKRVNITITDIQKAWLDNKSKKDEIGMSELIRRYINEDMDRHFEKAFKSFQKTLKRDNSLIFDRLNKLEQKYAIYGDVKNE